MIAIINKHNNRLLSCGMCFVILLMSSYVLLLSARNTILVTEPENASSVDRMLDGTANKPYVSRTLVPAIAHVVAFITPAAIEEAANNYLTPTRLNTLFLVNAKNIPDTREGYKIAIVLAVMLVSLWGYAAALYVFARKIFPENSMLALMSPIIGLSVLPAFLFWVKIYDFTQLMFITLCLYALACQRFRCYLILFTLACLNKETIVFLVFFFFIWFGSKLDKKKFWVLIVLQLELFLIVKLSLDYIYIDNFQRSGFLQASQVKAFLAGYSIQALVNVLLAVLLMAYRWQEKPLFLRYAFLSLFALQYPAYFFFCHEGEYRNFFEIFPLITLLGAHTLFVVSRGCKSAPSN